MSISFRERRGWLQTGPSELPAAPGYTTKRIARFQFLQDASVAFQQREQSVQKELPRGVVGFLDQRGEFRLAFPWLIWDVCPGGLRSELFVFNRLEGGQITYVAMETGHPHHPAGLAQRMAMFVREAMKAS